MSKDNRLGEFLRARRELVRPEHVGFPSGSPSRRVPGLRREEVASLAGISVEYLTRLERGKDRSPSPQVLDSIAEVLALDAAGVRYLHSLVWPMGRAPTPDPTEELVPGIARALARFDGEIAYVLNPYFDVIDRSRVAEAFLEGAGHGNQLEYVFLHPEAAITYPNWETVAAEAAAAFRTMVRGREDDEKLHTVLGRLVAGSGRFRQLWDRHDVHGNSSGTKRVANYKFGTITVTWDAFVTAYPSSQTLVLYTAEPDTPSARILESVRRSLH